MSDLRPTMILLALSLGIALGAMAAGWGDNPTVNAVFFAAGGLFGIQIASGLIDQTDIGWGAVMAVSIVLAFADGAVYWLSTEATTPPPEVTYAALLTLGSAVMSAGYATGLVVDQGYSPRHPDEPFDPFG